MTANPVQPFDIPGDEIEYTEHVEGRFGVFRTPAGTVSYILTSARLGHALSSPAASLTEHLRPVREVLPVDRMNFNQLLQRDLDDHRVATEIVPYLLGHHAVVDHPAFLPPILAVLLPITSAQLSDASFPSSVGPELTEDGHWIETRAGSHFRVRQLAAGSGSTGEHRSRHAVVSWHRRKSTLVVLDGQHRAMAMLAIHRTVNELWDEDPQGELYRHFYQAPVRQMLGDVDVPNVQIPVALCWFPDYFGEDRNPVATARKLFVDVNQSAKPPSQARLILLSDEDMINVFVRSMLNRLRGGEEAPDSSLPLYAVDYDNPDKQTRTARWSVITTVGMVRELIDRVIHGPNEIIEDLTAAYPRGGGATQPREARFRQQLGIDDWPIEIEDGERIFRRDEITSTNFPRGRREKLVSAFESGWSPALRAMFSELMPYRAHAQALSALRNAAKKRHSESDRLAREALFEGVGMYWVLRDSHNYYTTGGRASQAQGSVHEVLMAWDVLEELRAEFLRRRADLLGEEESNVDAAWKAFEVYRTQASQLGLALAIASISDRVGSQLEVSEVANEVISAVNAYATQKRSDAVRLGRWSFISPYVESALNRISDMNTPRGVEFRYFWLEAVRSGASEELKDLLDLRGMVWSSRKKYFDYRTGERFKELKRAATEAEPNEETLHWEATVEVRSELRHALNVWFEESASEWDAWTEQFPSPQPSANSEEE